MHLPHLCIVQAGPGTGLGLAWAVQDTALQQQAAHALQILHTAEYNNSKAG